MYLIFYIITWYVNVVHGFYFVSAGSNIVGKFTQSVRRIVQDVKDEGTASKLQN